MYINFTALRSLASGHTSGVAYYLESDVVKATPMHVVHKEVSTSFSRSQFTNLISYADRWSIRTSLILDADLALWQEFQASVAANETFTLDVYGTQAVPDNPQTVRIIDNPPKIERSGTLDYWYLTMEVEVVA